MRTQRAAKHAIMGHPECPGMSDRLRQFQRVVATVRSRGFVPDRREHSGMDQLEGKQFELMVAWHMGPADRFPDESA